MLLHTWSKSSLVKNIADWTRRKQKVETFDRRAVITLMADDAAHVVPLLENIEYVKDVTDLTEFFAEPLACLFAWNYALVLYKNVASPSYKEIFEKISSRRSSQSNSPQKKTGTVSTPPLIGSPSILPRNSSGPNKRSNNGPPSEGPAPKRQMLDVSRPESSSFTFLPPNESDFSFSRAQSPGTSEPPLDPSELTSRLKDGQSFQKTLLTSHDLDNFPTFVLNSMRVEALEVTEKLDQTVCVA